MKSYSQLSLYYTCSSSIANFLYEDTFIHIPTYINVYISEETLEQAFRIEIILLRDTHELIVTGVCIRAVTHVSITGPIRAASREFFLLLFYSFILFFTSFLHFFPLFFFCSHSFMLVSCYQTHTTRDDPVHWRNIKPRF